MDLGFWHILKDKNTGKIGLYYTDTLDSDFFEQEFDEDINDKEELDIHDVDAETVCELMGNMLEDKNQHRMCCIPDFILQALNDNSITEKQKANIMVSILEKFKERGLC